MKLIPVAERLAVKLLLPVFMTKVCRGEDSNTHPSAYEANAITDCATAEVIMIRQADITSDKLT